MSVTPDPSRMPHQPTLPWPGADEVCPKCKGKGDVYYLQAKHGGADVVGGKRVTCPACDGTGRVRVPAAAADRLFWSRDG
jgi:hypothetical protein